MATVIAAAQPTTQSASVRQETRAGEGCLTGDSLLSRKRGGLLRRAFAAGQAGDLLLGLGQPQAQIQVLALKLFEHPPPGGTRLAADCPTNRERRVGHHGQGDAALACVGFDGGAGIQTRSVRFVFLSTSRSMLAKASR